METGTTEAECRRAPLETGTTNGVRRRNPRWKRGRQGRARWKRGRQLGDNGLGDVVGGPLEVYESPCVAGDVGVAQDRRQAMLAHSVVAS